jgi:crossover junction endodeoxyribonuclease RusA
VNTAAILAFTVVGTPAPQGSKRGFYNKSLNRVQLVESSAKVKPWRQDVKAAALNAIANQPGAWATLDGPLTVTICFYLTRPRSHYGTGRNAQLLKPSAPTFPATKPDLDKLIRATLDAIGEAAVWVDDSRVVALEVTKVYADANSPAGADIAIRFTERALGPVVVSTALETADTTTAAPSIQEALL